jgi:hypothetical protein
MVAAMPKEPVTYFDSADTAESALPYHRPCNSLSVNLGGGAHVSC